MITKTTDNASNSRQLDWPRILQSACRLIESDAPGLEELARRSAETIAAKQVVSRKTLKILDTWLEKRRFLTESGYTIADMSVFAYVSRADEAGLPLANYPAVNSWVMRVRDQDGFLDKVYPYSIDPSSGSELP